MKKATWITIFLIFFLAVLGRQLLNLSKAIFAQDMIIIFIWLLFVPFAYFLFQSWKTKRPRFFCPSLHSYLFFGILALGLFMGYQLEIPEERIHVLLFGILGFVALEDFSGRSLVYVVLFGSFIACADEGLQYVLPYRVGDLRDVGLNIISFVWGVALKAFLPQPVVCQLEASNCAKRSTNPSA